MNKQRLPQRIGIIFLLITICTSNIVSGQQKNHSKTIDNLKSFEVYARGTSYSNCDVDSAAGRTSSLIPIDIVKSLGLQCIAVDHRIIPYGSVILGQDKKGQKIIGVAVDTGGDVKNRKAAKVLALKKGFDKDSPEYKAIVFDFHSISGDITKYWDTFTVIPYRGPDFKLKLNHREKVNHLKMVKSLYNEGKLPTLASR